MAHDPHLEHDRHTHDVGEPEANGLTSFALVKYGFIFLMLVAVLYFIARYLIPALV
ncbi:MAG TPA: hypothetical protein VNO79_01325 [Actinomycetota bacterium]|nr:hypothetical protein [Actinomycetota bacterium]